MLRNKFFLIILTVVSTISVSCNKVNNEDAVLWGKTNTYNPFLWKKQVPDTLKQTLCFDFNDDAAKQNGVFVYIILSLHSYGSTLRSKYLICV